MKDIKYKIVELEDRLKKVDSKRLSLKGAIDHTELSLKEAELQKNKSEQWVINTSFSLRDRKRKLRKLNLERENLKKEIADLKREIKQEEHLRLGVTYERVFIGNAKSMLDEETYLQIKKKTLEDMEEMRRQIGI